MPYIVRLETALVGLHPCDGPLILVRCYEAIVLVR